MARMYMIYLYNGDIGIMYLIVALSKGNVKGG